MNNEKKICFICCVNDEVLYEEAMQYINCMEIPEEYEVENIYIKDGISITDSYNKAMKESDAKYKIYMHQDVFIINKEFVKNIISIFKSDDNIGMIGVAGSKTIPSNGIWWESQYRYGKVYGNTSGRMQILKFTEVENEYEEVKCIDGLLMITQYDIPWRSDKFNGWHFYDISQSLEFRKLGYKVVIPKQSKPWCIHDSGIVTIGSEYEKNKSIFIGEYSQYLNVL
ncbi:hypothetical protein OXPF_28600 [Oxobacter pfennigii]|uniref:Streptomycin biosynthesis protein StrF domain-containing protein n=1 Tax=Oxobacter pfennigii TaxID=36849 RepID=A0A0P8W6N2_9CLOT|nr:hypothetical protein OXPF_28600 [Oxobacter pfennigii]